MKRFLYFQFSIFFTNLRKVIVIFPGLKEFEKNVTFKDKLFFSRNTQTFFLNILS